ncbi:MAG TPA: tetratricopeptide repeat protein [Bryobacteraceae bacterium]|nr:tetratricopeptide repeat protein [Bryobacteraceae bacterium]
MRPRYLIALLAINCCGYELTGRIDPPALFAVFLHGTTAPFEASTESDASGRFQFHKLAPGTYTLVISTAARGALQRTIELSPGTVDSRGRLNLALRIENSRLESDGKRSTGATVAATVLSIPDSAVREFREAQRCLQRRDSDCASGHLRRAVQVAPQFVAAWNQLGTIAYQTQRYADAETNFREALRSDPEAFEPLVNLGGVLLNLGRPEEAIGYNKRAVERRPNDALANSQLGMSYLQLNELDPAEKYLKTAVQLDPAHFSHPQLSLAGIYIKRGDRQSAASALRGFLEQHPDSPRAVEIREKIAQLSQ